MVCDVERGAPGDIQEKEWQTCTCIGSWHYNRPVYENDQYKSARDVVQMLVDIVSKNGNLLLNIPVRGDGTIDEKEVAILEDIAAWMEINSECIYETRPWLKFGEGPKAESANPIHAQGFNEGKGQPYTAEDIRFTQKGDVLYAIVMECPYANDELEKVRLLGGESVIYSFDDKGLPDLV